MLETLGGRGLVKKTLTTQAGIIEKPSHKERMIAARTGQKRKFIYLINQCAVLLNRSSVIFCMSSGLADNRADGLTIRSAHSRCLPAEPARASRTEPDT
jgi:hypothetical protein